MLERPDLSEARIVACLQDAYGLAGAQVTFLPLGADASAAVYRADAADGGAYFLKLRRGNFDEIAVALPRFLRDQGIRQVIAPLPARDGRLWADLAPFRAILYPFVAGRNGYEADLTDEHWLMLGAALKAVHALAVPPALARRIPRESYSPRWREAVRAFQAQVEAEVFTDPVAARVAALLRAQRPAIDGLVARAEARAQALRACAPAAVLCHSDVHAGNVLLADEGSLYIVDWDSPIRAPKERDLMYAGGGQFGGRRSPGEEERLFYRGYGAAEVDRRGLAYYRYERIIEDIAAFCEQLLLSTGGGDDRQQSLQYLAANFLPGGTIAIARTGDRDR